MLLLSDTPCCKPIPFKVEGGRSRIAVRTLDCYYIFELDAASGEAQKLARYEKDYTVKFEPGVKIAAFMDVVVRINEKLYDWDALLKGVEMDYLPKSFDIVLEGTAPSGRRITISSKLEVEDPEITPASGR